MATAPTIPDPTNTTLFMQSTIAKHYGALPAEWWAIKTRQRHIVTARQIFMYLMRKYTDYSLSVIGAICGRRDHTTVIYGCNNVENLILFDRVLAPQIARMEAIIAAYTAEGMNQVDELSTYWPRGHASAHLIETHF